jgi:hypothetical protein
MTHLKIHATDLYVAENFMFILHVSPMPKIIGLIMKCYQIYVIW